MNEKFFNIALDLKKNVEKLSNEDGKPLNIDEEFIELILSFSEIIYLQIPGMFTNAPLSRIDKPLTPSTLIQEINECNMTEDISILANRIGVVNAYCKAMAEVLYKIHTHLTEIVEFEKVNIH